MIFYSRYFPYTEDTLIHKQVLQIAQIYLLLSQDAQKGANASGKWMVKRVGLLYLR